LPVIEKIEVNKVAPVTSTQIFKYNPKEESTPIYLLGHHKQERKEKLTK